MYNKSVEIQLELFSILVLLGCFPFSVAVCIIFHQSFMWMNSGEWLYITIDMAVKKLFNYSSFNEWLTNPQSLYGLHKIISNTSLSSFLFLFVAFYFILVMYIFVLIDFFEKKYKKRRVSKP